MALHAARAIRQKQKLDEYELTPGQRKTLEEAFEAADKDGNGILSADEYYQIFQSHGLSVEKEWIERTIAKNDKDGDGGISFDEFLDMNMKGKRNKSNATSPVAGPTTSLDERARLAFNAYDRNRDGYLTKGKLKRTSKNMTHAQIEAVFEKYDKNRDGKLDFKEFKELLESNQKN